jgi:hypothetical protein
MPYYRIKLWFYNIKMKSASTVRKESRDSAVSTETGYGLGGPGQDFSLYAVQTGPGGPSSLCNAYRELFPRG